MVSNGQITSWYLQPIRNVKTNRAPGPSQPAVDADGVELPVNPGKNEDLANGDKL